MKNITITIDVEEDCPPMLTSTRGMEEGLPKLLDLFKKEGIKATFFVTGMMAEAVSGPDTENSGRRTRTWMSWIYPCTF